MLQHLEDLALEPSVQGLVSEFGESTGLRADFHAHITDDLDLAPEVAQAVYRAVQEGHRHAHARTVNVLVDASAERVALEVIDDGLGAQGMNDAAENGGGYGLIGLRQRVELLDGQLEFGPAPERGSRLRIVLPVPRTS